MRSTNSQGTSLWAISTKSVVAGRGKQQDLWPGIQDVPKRIQKQRQRWGHSWKGRAKVMQAFRKVSL